MQIDDERDLVPHMRRRDWFDRLARHVSRCVSEGSQYLDMGPPRRFMRGVTSVMRQELWTACRPRRLVPAAAAHTTKAKTRTKATTKKKNAHTSTGAAVEKRARLAVGGAMRGTLIHRQLHDAIALDEANFMRLHPDGSHPWLRPLVQALVQRRWQPARSEFVTRARALRMATRIDLICVDEEGRLVFIELKTGYDPITFHETADGRWLKGSPPHRHRWPCTPFRRAVVQCMLGALMLAAELDLPDAAYRTAVVRVDDAAVELIEIEHHVLSTVGAATYAAILAGQPPEGATADVAKFEPTH